LSRNIISNLPHYRLFEALFDIVNSAILSAPSVIGPFHHFNLHYRCHPSKGYQVQETDYIFLQDDVHALLLEFTYLTLYSDPWVHVMLYVVSCLVILPLFVVSFLKQIVAISTLRNSRITSFSLLTNLVAYFIDCIRRNTTSISTTFRRHSWYLKPFRMNESFFLIWNPLKNDSNIDNERRESTTIYFTSIRQSNECVGGIEWTEWCCSMKIAWKAIFAFLAFPAFLSVRSRSWSFPQSFLLTRSW
jgi:hypothetical protein